MSDIIDHPEAYFRRFLPEREPLLLDLEKEAEREGIPIVGPLVGELLHILARATQAERILELGTATGYSTICLARSFNSDSGRLVTIESDVGLYEKSQESLLRARSRALDPGDTLPVAGITATVLDVNDDGVPTRVAFQLPANQDDYIFHLWHRGEPVQCTLSAPGTRITLTQDTESC